MTERDSRKVFGKNLSDILYEKRITQKDLAKYMGVSSATASEWCSGKKMPRIDKLTSIANYLHVSMTDLVEDHSGVGKSQHLEYYTNPETAAVAQEIFDDSDLHALFDAARDSKPEDLRMAADLLRRLKGTNPDG